MAAAGQRRSLADGTGSIWTPASTSPTANPPPSQSCRKDSPEYPHRGSRCRTRKALSALRRRHPEAQHVETHHFPYLTRSLAAIPLPCTRGRLRELRAIMPGRPQLGRQEVLLDPCLPIPGSLPSVSESESHWRLVLLLQPDSHDCHCGVGPANGHLRVARKSGILRPTGLL